MKQILSVRLPLLLGLSLLLLACGARQVAPEDDAEAASAYQERQQRISALDSWTLSGRLSVDDGQDGGSGRLSWRVDGANARLEFRAALRRGAWRLDIS
ncbi:MAG TPA: lipoprotein insertase outer membrane protein LolB, partial [Xanthomonadales bacterium]|nr:lipoprotein insertase outer membrane protein LolB [Xanthomonadales bacterium]